MLSLSVMEILASLFLVCLKMMWVLNVRFGKDKKRNKIKFKGSKGVMFCIPLVFVSSLLQFS